MARWFEPDEAQQAEWKSWVDSRPEAIRSLCERFPPWELFRLRDTGHRVYAAAFHDNGTLTVAVTKEFNALAFERQVFGIAPEDLEPCDLPAEGEPLGVLLDEDEQIAYINERRAENGLPPLEQDNER